MKFSIQDKGLSLLDIFNFGISACYPVGDQNFEWYTEPHSNVLVHYGESYMKDIVERLNLFIESAWNISDSEGYYSWLRQLVAFLEVAAGEDIAQGVDELCGVYPHEWKKYRDRQVGHLEGLAISLVRLKSDQSAEKSQSVTHQNEQLINSKTVFLVHGHDTSAKESTARFLEKLRLAPVILHEQANEGQTIIEKFEVHSNVGYAVVLLTPDDIGASSSSPDKLSKRARQNVILELGYFTGKLGRRRVCGLFKPGVEIPSDFHGVLFIELDEQGGWRTKLAQELVGAGMKIDLKGLLKS
jgi:predicted nucleotide-binding protein